MAELTSRVGKASLWIVMSRLGANLLAFATTAVLARLLTPTDFGLVATASAIHFTLGAMTDLSMTQSLIATRDPTRDHFNTAWTLLVVRGLVLALVLAISAPFVAAFFGDPRLTLVLQAFALITVITGFNNPRMAALHRELNFSQDVIMQICAKLTGLIAACAIAFAYQSYWALVASIGTFQIVYLLMSYWLLPYMPRLSFRYVRELLGFSLWLTFSQLLDALVLRVDTVLVSRLLGARTLGIFSVGESVAILPIRETSALIYLALTPAFAKLRDDAERLRSAYRRALTLMVALALPIGAGMAVTGDLIVGIMLGEQWREAVIVVQIIGLATAIQSVQQPGFAVAVATGATRMLFWLSLALFVVRVPMTVAGIALGGLVGVVWARLAGGVVSAAAYVWLVRRLTGLGAREQLLANTRTIIAALIMALAVVALRSLMPGEVALAGLVAQMLACVVAGGLVYLAAMFGLWRLAGTPLGAEQEIIHFARLGIARLAASRQVR
jgi:O-antigen/teichoic acid export membrane protein